MKTIKLENNSDLLFNTDQLNVKLMIDECDCSLYLEDDEWVGVTPYGQDNYFNIGDKDRVRAWLEFWSEDRDEWGNLLSSC